VSKAILWTEIKIWEKGKDFKTQSGVRCHNSNNTENNAKMMNVENFIVELLTVW
jgi:hypothetical protein